jgi:hypothetical protein
MIYLIIFFYFVLVRGVQMCLDFKVYYMFGVKKKNSYIYTSALNNTVKLA